MKKKEIKELDRIGESIPKELLNRLIVQRYAAPAIRKVVKAALKDDGVSEEKKEQLRNLQSAGYFDKKEDVVNKSAQKEIDAYINEEIAKSVMAGRLPEPKSNTLVAKYIKKCKKKLSRSSSKD